MYFTCAQQVADLMTYAMPLCACGKKGSCTYYSWYSIEGILCTSEQWQAIDQKISF